MMNNGLKVITFDLERRDWLAVFLRLRKRCPVCNGRVRRTIKSILLSEGYRWERTWLFFERKHVTEKEWQIRYACSTCEKRFWPRAFW